MTTATCVAAVSLNPAIDQTVFVPGFAAGAVNRVASARSDAGGKAVNVACFLADAGVPVAATGLLGDANGESFIRLFADKGIVDRCVRIPGATRTNIKIVDKRLRLVTELNFRGLPIGADDLRRLGAEIDGLADDADWFVLSGSVPDGMPDDTSARLVERLKRQGRRVVLDASGRPFAAAIDGRPDIVKPNIDELEELVGARLESEVEVFQAARTLVGRGIGLVVASMGPRGAVFVEGDAAVVAVPPPNVRVRSTVGAGDAMVAGLVAGALQGLGLADRARLATAVALGALGEISSRLPPADTVRASMAHVGIRPPGQP